MLVPSSSWEHSAAQHTIALHPPTQRHPFLLCTTRNPLETHPAPLLCDLSEHSRILLCCRDERVSKQSTTTERPTGTHARKSDTPPSAPLPALSLVPDGQLLPTGHAHFNPCLHSPTTHPAPPLPRHPPADRLRRRPSRLDPTTSTAYLIHLSGHSGNSTQPYPPTPTHTPPACSPKAISARSPTYLLNAPLPSLPTTPLLPLQLCTHPLIPHPLMKARTSSTSGTRTSTTRSRARALGQTTPVVG